MYSPSEVEVPNTSPSAPAVYMFPFAITCSSVSILPVSKSINALVLPAPWNCS